ncbi:MAG: diphthine--ammonia ligase [Flavobacteriaceae bacterium]|uniref:Diphthine--ammonia ligase n=1 Tax=Flavobacterium kayseriense TaxID=2764714 RepID=A0ABR7J6Z3_9FLAO|nr:diphthine--ammonia ligase [Flavobacterium kayseriense]MBC5841243.1 diphthine--ammonia ligase [Flavobacterium kayseriense]MBC5847771.1 diphthine--ammonia ligase [Flavobacterium kayseriense]MBU0939981.1 diphthine--ammonia ligase [Bacteroidota bacterium]MBX9887510.1 diphthine--ammonia ligase [Flavobacteriaceae bacterium]
MNFVTSWSGGKDSCYALMLAIEQGLTPKVLLNMMNENGKVSRSHGLPLSILKQQASKMQVPLEGIPASWTDYEKEFIGVLNTLKESYDLDAAVFGDIDLQAHKDWEDKVCLAVNLKAILPLWQQERIVLVNEMIDRGIETMIVSCNSYMGEGYLGRILTKELAIELQQLGIDPCGENGEFHTMVINCPLFFEPIVLPQYSKKTYDSYCFLVWEEFEYH